jgi:phytoene dehydrogenase-like protein
LSRFKPSLSALLFYLGMPPGSLPDDWPYFISICTTLDQEGMHESLEKGFMDNGLHMVITTPTVIDPSLGPEGHHSLKVLVHGPGSSQFQKTYGNERVLEDLQEKIFSLIHSYTGVDVVSSALFVEKATPMTLLRLTGNEEGAMYGFDAALNQVGPMRPPNRTSLDNLLWVGHYTHPAHGIVGSAMSGRFASEIILASQRK